MRKRLFLLSTMVLTFSGCTHRTPPPASPAEMSARPAELKLLTLPPSATRMEAALSGPLLLDSGCAQVARSSGKASLVWSGSATVDPGGAILYRGHRFAQGDRVRFGGGFITLEDTPALGPQMAASNCAAPYFLVQTVEEPLP